MMDLVPYGSLFVVLATCVATIGAWCTWYIRKRLRGVSKILSTQVDERMSAMADALAARIDAKLDTASKDFAVATARMNSAVEHVERIESSWQMNGERISVELSGLRSEISQRRWPNEQHPQTVAEIEHMHDKIRLIDLKLDRMAVTYQEAVLAAAMRYTRRGSA